MTRSCCEEVVERALRQSGYRVYLPRYRKLLRPHGSSRKFSASMRPLLPMLVFAQDWQGWPERRIPSAVGLMPGGLGRHASLCDGDIAELMAAERACCHDDTIPKGAGPLRREDLSLGDQVECEQLGQRITGTLERLTPKGRAIIRDLIGRIVEIDADIVDLVSA